MAFQPARPAFAGSSAPSRLTPTGEGRKSEPVVIDTGVTSASEAEGVSSVEPMPSASPRSGSASTFSGTIEQDKLTGVLSNDQGESDVTGQRSPRLSPAAGRWEMKYKVGDRDVTSTLVVTPDKEGRLAARWESPFGEHEISDFSYERRAVNFKRKSKMQDRQWESTFNGTIAGDALTGTIKSEMGDVDVQGARLGAAAIGTWNLDVETEWGPIKQRLVVHPDMSALYGTMPIKKVEFADGKLTFGLVVPLGDEEFKMDFAGKITDGKLAGQMTTSRGTQELCLLYTSPTPRDRTRPRMPSSA